VSRPRSLAGSVYRRKSGRFDLWFYDRAGRKRRCAAKATDAAGARSELAGILGRVAKGEDPTLPADMTVASWCRRWIELRRAAGKGEADNEEGHLERHVLPELGRVRLVKLSAAAVLDLVRALPLHKAPRGEAISATTVRHIAGTLRLALRDAVKRGILAATPCVWDASDLPERGAPAIGEGFSGPEVATLVGDARIPEDRRVLYALEFLTGMRTGEAAARRWRDWDPGREPLGALKVETSWSTKLGREKETKTRTRRVVPVHPALALLLTAWRASGWDRFQGRHPDAGDLIIPGPDGEPRSNTRSWELFQEDLAALGLAAQRHYESRATFLSLAEAGGAELATVRLLTHPSPKAAADLYRRQRILWPRLCAAVLAIELGGIPSR
jgi:integrase